jgi:hypothetical protein
LARGGRVKPLDFG